ncbi:hypothetical protein SCA6_010065 [Theobroma cacao]
MKQREANYPYVSGKESCTRDCEYVSGKKSCTRGCEHAANVEKKQIILIHEWKSVTSDLHSLDADNRMEFSLLSITIQNFLNGDIRHDFSYTEKSINRSPYFHEAASNAMGYLNQ